MPAILLDQFRNNPVEDNAWLKELQLQLPTFKIIERRPGPTTPQQRAGWEDVHYALIWSLPAEELKDLPNLRAILLQGTGADHLRPFHTIPPHVPIVRLVDPQVAYNMAMYIAHWVIHYHFNFDTAMQNQRQMQWGKRMVLTPTQLFTVGVLGAGNIGRQVCETLLSLGYRVCAYSRTLHKIHAVRSFAADQLQAFLAELDVLVNVLPLTAETENMLDEAFLYKLPKGAVLINVGRGGTVRESALIHALDNDHLKAAVLDCFCTEPLPKESPLWKHDRVVVTPHMAGRTFARSAVKVVVDNIRRMENGEQPFPLVDRERGY